MRRSMMRVRNGPDRPPLRSQAGQFRRLFRFTRPYRIRLAVGTIAVIAAAGLGLVFPSIMGRLVDSVLAGSRDRRYWHA